jgi:restriction system protein
MDSRYRYPPELFELLVEAIPRLFKGKDSVLQFFLGAGVSEQMLRDLALRLKKDRDGVNKFEIVRVALTRLNEGGDATLRQRREVLKRVSEFDDYSSAWPDQQLEAKGLVSQVRDIVNVKDSFTRMRIEADRERHQRQSAQQAKIDAKRAEREAFAALHRELRGLFAPQDAVLRGKHLESVLNRLFVKAGISVAEAFTRVGTSGERNS